MIRNLAAFVLLVAFAVSMPLVAAQQGGTTYYIYDSNGRLRAVVSPVGGAAVYEYDPAGNFVSITRRNTTSVSITSFSPATGPESTSVTIQGTGFSATPTDNLVAFNGVIAGVGSSTTSQIVTSVPAGATTGPIIVLTPTGVAVTSSPFVVTGSRLPSITGFTPSIGLAGMPVTITGTNFDTDSARDQVTFNITRASTAAATATSISTTVPTGATSGRITVATPLGTPVSDDDFFVPPAPYTVSSVAVTGRTTIGASRSVTLSAAGKIALLVFDGTQGQRISLRRENPIDSYLAIFKPNGERLAETELIFNTGTFGVVHYQNFLDAVALPVTGTYTMMVTTQGPLGRTPTGTETETLYNVPPDITASIIPGGPPVTVPITTPGQRASLTFNGSAGQPISLTATGTLQRSLTIKKPDGTDLVITPLDFIDKIALPVSGTYTIQIIPVPSTIGNLVVQLYTVPPDAADTITVGGAPVSLPIAIPGQNARVTFTGAAGQLVGLRVGTGSLAFTSAASNPDGSVLSGSIFDGVVLPVAGLYTVFIDPTGVATGSVTLSLIDGSDVTSTIVIGGPPVTSSTMLFGQAIRLSFSGTAGQRVSFNVVAPATATMLKPDGSPLSSGFGFIDTVVLPVTGSYSIQIAVSTPSTETATLYEVPPDATRTIAAGEPRATLTISVPGQNARINFNGTSGQQAALNIGDVTLGSGDIAVYKPDGTTLVSPTPFGAGGLPLNLTLPATGTYLVVVDPTSNTTGSFSVSLTVNDSASIAIGGPPVTVTVDTAGQTANLTFDGTAGQRVSLGISNITIGSAVVTLFAPDGSVLTQTFAVAPSGFIDVFTLPETGRYSIRIEPQFQDPATGSLVLTLYGVPADASGVVSVGGGPLQITVATPGQNALVTFSGTQGQRVQLRMTGITISRSLVSLKNPDGSSMAADPLELTTAGLIIDIQKLPATGTYTVLIDPQGAAIGSTAVSLSSDNPGSIAAGGLPVIVIVSATQPVGFTFNGTAGQRVALFATGSTVLGGEPGQIVADLTIKRPDGTTLIRVDVIFNTPFTDAVTLPTTGTYSASIGVRGNGGVMTTILYDVPPDPSGTIVIGGPPVTLTTTTPGQNGRLNFDGIAGQKVTLVISNQTVFGSIRILEPDGTLVTNLENLILPATGSYSIVIDPQESSTGQITFQLYDVPPDVAGTITVGGPPVTVTTTAPGQNGRLTFSGFSGQRISVVINNVTISPLTSVTLLSPSGTTISSVAGISAGENRFIEPLVLPTTGVYTLLVDPQQNSLGSVTLTVYEVPADVTGAITIGGAPVPVTINTPGQNAVLSFNGTAGQQVTVRATNSLIGCLSLSLRRPDGSVLTSVFTCDSTLDLTTATLSVAGTYTIRVDPSQANSGSITVRLTSP